MLAARRWAVTDDWLPAPRVAALRAEAEALESEGRFHDAGIGRDGVRHERVRGDRVMWFESGVSPEANRLLRDELESLRYAINAETYLGLYEFEGHYTCFPPGAHYARHVDRFQDGGERVVSMVLYLNDRWTDEVGGALCLYPGAVEGPVKILPQAGTLVCFLSDHIPHEVLPSQRMRWSLTGWYKRRG